MFAINRVNLAGCVAVGLAALLAGSFGLSAASKGSRLVDEAPALINAMSDFEFVGSGPFSDELSVPPHGMKRKLLPTRLEAGHAYIFHHASVDNNRLVRELVDRLKTRGVKVFDVVDHGTGRYVGGLAFRLSFEDAGYRGFIYNTLDNRIVRNERIARRLSFDDYIVVIQQAVQ